MMENDRNIYIYIYIYISNSEITDDEFEDDEISKIIVLNVPDYTNKKDESDS